MIGIDIEKIERFKALKKTELNRIWTKKELEYCFNFNEPYSHLAGMWCIKEAFIKALKNKEIPLKNIEILHNVNGAPYINITKNLECFLIGTDYSYIDISLSHTSEDAIGIVEIL